MKLRKLFLMSAFGLFSYCILHLAYANSYTLSTFLNMNPDSKFAHDHCPKLLGSHRCYVEGSALDSAENLYLTFASPKGKIYRITPQGSVTLYAEFPASPINFGFFNGVSLRLAFDKQDNLYTFFMQKNLFGLPSHYFGLWKIQKGGGKCNLNSNSGPCIKIWPHSNEILRTKFRFGNGIALDDAGHAYLADSQMGNIWKINLAQGTAEIWSGKDAMPPTDLLAGNPANFLLGFAPSIFGGRGLGIIDLAIDSTGRNLYASNFDKGLVIRIPIKADGLPDRPQVLLNLTQRDEQLDAVYLDEKNNNLYITLNVKNFISLVNFIATLFFIVMAVCLILLAPLSTLFFLHFIGFSSALVTFNPNHLVIPQFQDGNTVIVLNLVTLNAQTLIHDPKIGIATGIVATDKGTVYINVFKSNDLTGSKILNATSDR